MEKRGTEENSKAESWKRREKSDSLKFAASQKHLGLAKSIFSLHNSLGLNWLFFVCNTNARFNNRKLANNKVH